MANDNTLEGVSWPVNELGELILTQGSGSGNIVGQVPLSFIPVDARTGTVKTIFVKSPTESATPSAPLTLYLSEGRSVTFTGNAAVGGVITKYKANGTVDFTATLSGNTVSSSYGPYAGLQLFVVTCAAGSIDATVGDAVLNTPKPRLRNSNAPAYSPYGYSYNSNGGGLANAISCTIKLDVEAGYEALQVAKFSNQLKALSWKCIIAGTETADRSNANNSYVPMVGGVAYNAMRNGTTDLYGWDAVKFGGLMPFSDTPCPNVLAGCAFTVASNVVTVAIPAQTVAPAVGSSISFLDLLGNAGGAATYIAAGIKTVTASSTTSVSFAQTTTVTSGTCNLLLGNQYSTPGLVASDIIDSHWVPRGTINAADIGQTRSLVVMRTYADGALNNPPLDWTNRAATNDSPTAANRGRIAQIAGTFADCVGTLSNSFSGTNFYTHPFIIIPHYRRRSISVAFVGDSTFESTFLAADAFSAWGVKGCADVSTPDLPVVPLNLGMGTSTSDMFLSRAKTMLPLLKPDIAVFEAFSPNDITNPTQISVWAQERRVVEFLRFCSDNGIYPILTTPLPNNNISTTVADAFRLQVRSMVLDIANSRGVSVLDFGFIGDGASPERFKAQYNAPASPVHQNEAAMEIQAAALAQLLRFLI